MATLLGLKSGLDGSFEADKKTGTTEEYTLTYLVQASSGDTVAEVLATSGLPVLYSVYNNAYCKTKTAHEVDSASHLWEVEVTFSTAQDSDGDENEEPTNRLEISWGVEQRDILVTHDQVSGDEIVNSVGEPLLVTKQFAIPRLIIKRLERNFDPDVIINYGNHVNEKKFWGAEPDCVLLSGPTAEQQIVKGKRYYYVTYVFKFNFLRDENHEFIGWQAYLLNQGTKYWDAALGRYVLFRTEGDMEVGNLTDDADNPRKGTKRAANLPGEYLYFYIYPQADFDDLGLNNK